MAATGMKNCRPGMNDRMVASPATIAAPWPTSSMMAINALTRSAASPRVFCPFPPLAAPPLLGLARLRAAGRRPPPSATAGALDALCGRRATGRNRRHLHVGGAGRGRDHLQRHPRRELALVRAGEIRLSSRADLL